MPVIPLRKLSDAKKRGVFAPIFDGPCLVGRGDVDYTCPECKTVLARSIVNDHIFEVAIECHSCGTVGAFPPLPPGSVILGVPGFMPTGKYLISKAIDVHEAIFIGALDNGEMPMYQQRAAN